MGLMYMTRLQNKGNRDMYEKLNRLMVENNREIKNKVFRNCM